jgi:hypothetical protein
MQIVYASERPSDLGDRIFKNPRHFLTADTQATKVFIVGAGSDFRNVELAYQALKVPVTRLAPGEPLDAKPAKVKPAEPSKT